jgi:hypothetical protein
MRQPNIQHLREGIADRVAKRLRRTAIKCIEAEQTEAARPVSGEVDRLQ